MDVTTRMAAGTVSTRTGPRTTRTRAPTLPASATEVRPSKVADIGRYP